MADKNTADLFIATGVKEKSNKKQQSYGSFWKGCIVGCLRLRWLVVCGDAKPRLTVDVSVFGTMM